MSLTSQLPQLNDSQLKSLCDTLLTAAMVYENDGNYREIFRRAKYRHLGLMRRIYELLQHATRDEIDALSNSLSELQP